MYHQNRSQNTFDILLANHRSCDVRKVGRNPLMCCTDNVPQELQPSQNQQLGSSCSTPDGISGYCINIKQCPAVYNTFIQRPNDPENVEYIRNSNTKCGYVSEAICCPNDAPTVQPTAPQLAHPQSLDTESVATLLPSPPECGVSRVPRDRIIVNGPAKKGK